MTTTETAGRHHERAAFIKRIKGAIRGNLSTDGAEIACAALDFAEATYHKRDVSASIERMRRFGIDDCDGFRDLAKTAASNAYRAFAAATSDALNRSAVRA